MIIFVGPIIEQIVTEKIPHREYKYFLLLQGIDHKEYFNQVPAWSRVNCKEKLQQAHA
jgi:hypothetical protein